ncbi:MAG TPA: hypothetical protein VK943_20010, partial [Arenibaculum sp.]|nr:hypothetical protein [Arenibaculum sp.]
NPPSRRYWFRPAEQGRSSSIIQLDNQLGAHDDYLLVAGLELGLRRPEKGSPEEVLRTLRWQAMQDGWCRIGVIHVSGSPVSAYVNAVTREHLLRASRFVDAELRGTLERLELQIERAAEMRDVLILAEKALERYLTNGAVTGDFVPESELHKAG